MKSSLFGAALLCAFSTSSAFAQGIGGVTAASRGVTSGVSPSLSTSIPAPTTATEATPQTAMPQMTTPKMVAPLTEKQRIAMQRDYDLFNAADAGETWRIRDLLKAGANIEAADWQYGFTPLMWAAKNGHVGAVRYLLSRGAKVNARSKSGVRLTFEDKATNTDEENGVIYRTALVSESGGITALHAATAAGWGLAARELILGGADVNATNPDGDTALMAAAYHNDLLTLKALLAKGAKTGAVDRYGRSALWLAAWRGHNDIVRELLARGAKPSPDAAGLWPGDAARLAKNTGTAALLAKAERNAKAARNGGKSTVENQATGTTPAADAAMTRGALAGRGGIIILN
jgi:ankyrin repeat protein